MGLIRFSDLINFSVGTNSTRLSEEKTDNEIYNIEDFDSDLSTTCDTSFNNTSSAEKSKNVIAVEGDVIFSMTRSKAGIVSANSSGKYLNSNFVKCEFDKEILYPWYFCYLLNESEAINQQIKRVQQGTLGYINRLTINMIGSLEFNMPDISLQRTIGDMYRNMLIQERLTMKQMNDMKKFTLEILKRAEMN